MSPIGVFFSLLRAHPLPKKFNPIKGAEPTSVHFDVVEISPRNLSDGVEFRCILSSLECENDILISF